MDSDPHGWGCIIVMGEGEKEQDMSYMAKGKREVQSEGGEKLLIKPSDLMRLTHYHENSMGKTHPHHSVTSHQFPPTTCGNCGSYNSRWDLDEDTAKPYQSLKSHPCPVVIRCTPPQDVKWGSVSGQSFHPHLVVKRSEFPFLCQQCQRRSSKTQDLNRTQSLIT